MKFGMRPSRIICSHRSNLGSVHRSPRCDLNYRLQVDSDPRLLAHGADANLNPPKRGLDRGRTIAVGDGGCRASHKTTATDNDSLADTGPAVTTANDHGERTREQNVLFERRPLFHSNALWWSDG